MAPPDAELDAQLQTIAQTINMRNGEALAHRLSVLHRPRMWTPSPAAVTFIRQLVDAGTLARAAGAYGVGDRWGTLIAEQLGAAVLLDSGDCAGAYARCVAGYNALLNQLRDESAWILPLLLRLTCDVRRSFDACVAPPSHAVVSRADAHDSHGSRPRGSRCWRECR